MGAILHKPKSPKPAPLPAPLPPPPVRSDAETQSLAEEQRKRISAQGSGRASTFLTQGGVDQGSSAVRFLGGAAKT